ncbi:hypothetical protein C5167_047036, partial [Papaver somniferum]
MVRANKKDRDDYEEYSIFGGFLGRFKRRRLLIEESTRWSCSRVYFWVEKDIEGWMFLGKEEALKLDQGISVFVDYECHDVGLLDNTIGYVLNMDIQSTRYCIVYVSSLVCGWYLFDARRIRTVVAHQEQNDLTHGKGVYVTQKGEEELRQQKRNKKRKIKGNPRLSFTDDIENESDEDEAENNKNEEPKKHENGKLGKDPTVETSFLPDSEREAEEQDERERLKNKSLIVTEMVLGDSIGEFLRYVQQKLAPEFREIRATSVENLLYVKEDLIIPHFYDLIINKARGKSGPICTCRFLEKSRNASLSSIWPGFRPEILQGTLTRLTT